VKKTFSRYLPGHQNTSDTLIATAKSGNTNHAFNCVSHTPLCFKTSLSRSYEPLLHCSIKRIPSPNENRVIFFPLISESRKASLDKRVIHSELYYFHKYSYDTQSVFAPISLAASGIIILRIGQPAARSPQPARPSSPPRVSPLTSVISHQYDTLPMQCPSGPSTAPKTSLPTF